MAFISSQFTARSWNTSNCILMYYVEVDELNKILFKPNQCIWFVKDTELDFLSQFSLS